MTRKFFPNYESYKEVLVDVRPLGIGRLTRVVICGLLAATAFPASALAVSSTSADSLTVDNPVPIVDTCTNETTPSTGLIHFVMQTQPDGTYKFFFSAQGSGIDPLTGVKLTLSQEDHEFISATPIADDYHKVIRSSETAGILPTYPGDDEFVHTHFDGVNTTITFECR
jgi:hypothetical protein